MDKHLHIVSFDVPYPADYGGVIDVFFTLQALKAANIQVHLHCFQYGRPEQPLLNQYCTEVTYYVRHTGHKGISHHLPYIVSSRSSEVLIEKLLQDDYPVLLEGIHCTYLLSDPRFAARKIFVRLHNVEHTYYRQLASTTRSWIKKIYYLRESRQLKQYELNMAAATTYLSLSQQDVRIYQNELQADHITYLPTFVPFEQITCKEGIGCYCLYHGNLSVPENEAAARWLLKKVFNQLTVPLVIAGKNPSRALEKLAAAHRHTCLVANPSPEELQDMIAKAQINILPSFNQTGVKLKLINALFNGRHCVVNEAAVKGTELETACHIGTTAEALRQIIIQLYHHPFTNEEIKLRQAVLGKQFNNKINAEKLIQSIW